MFFQKHITWRISPIMLRILAVNVGALLILGIGLLYSGQYERELIRTELSALVREGELLASAIAEGGTRPGLGSDPVLAEDLARHMLRKLSETNQNRTLLFGRTGTILVDTHQLLGPGGVVEIVALPAPVATLAFTERIKYHLRRMLDYLPTRLRLPRLSIQDRQHAQDYPHMIEALSGAIHTVAWRDADGSIILTASLPVQNLKNVIGAVLLLKQGGDIDAAVREVQLTVIQIFLYTLLITVLLSFYLSETIARPIMRLAQAADKVRQSLMFRDTVPDLSYRKDEIGTLSVALREMTEALSERVDAIGHFAADVAHEIKNPLASVKSAVETLSIIKEEEQRQKLIRIIDEDVNRMNRLITDISNASRLDSEVARAEKKSFALKGLIEHVIGQTAVHPRDVEMTMKDNSDPLIYGNDGQIFQVFQNLLSNALSFVNSGSAVRISIATQGTHVIIHVDNDGPPIPEHKLEGIFARFYSERPKGERFGQHSGLGLSISRQIVKAHQGTIYAENMKEGGVRFTVILPMMGKRA